MKMVKQGLAVLLFLSLAIPAFAAELKVGVVNIARVMEEAPQADSARAEMEKEFKPRERQLLEMQKEVRGMEERLQRNGAIMSETERKRLENDIRSKVRDLKRDEELFREDLNIKRAELLDKLQRELVAVIQDYAQAQKYDLLLAEGVVYVGEKLDVTDEVLNKLKKGSK